MKKWLMASLCLAILGAASCDQATPGKVAADNTGKNQRDEQTGGLTAQDQSNSDADRALTQKIRQAIMSDDALSVNAQNVKVITLSGMVTLRGPVNSEDEKVKIGTKAEQIAGAGRVSNQLEVATN